MNVIDKLERKFPRFGITHLMKYVICINIAGAVLAILDATGVFGVPIYANYLSLDFYQIFHGQVWRLVTWLLYPIYSFSGGGMMINLLWFAIWAYVYYYFGTNLERIWGKFRFNLFYLGGIFFVMLVTLVFYLVNCALTGDTGLDVSQYWGWYIGMAATLEYLNETLFLAYALQNPNQTFLLYFLIPFKAKWLAFISLALLGYNLITFIIHGVFYGVVLILGALINLAIFFIFSRGSQGAGARVRQGKRRREFEKKARGAWSHSARPHESTPTGGARHKCAICGRTELDAPQLEFRYCSRCQGNYEYCSDHLFSHTHITGLILQSLF